MTTLTKMLTMLAMTQGSHRRGYYVFYVNLFNLEVILGYMLFLFKLEVNVYKIEYVFNLDIILHYFLSVRMKSRFTYKEK